MTLRLPAWRRLVTVVRGVVGFKAVWLCTVLGAAAGNVWLGPMALLELPGGLQVAVASRKVQAADREMFRHLGVEPAACRILALKSSVHFRADFGPIAGEVLIAAAPGPVAADPGALAFTRLRPGVAQRP